MKIYDVLDSIYHKILETDLKDLKKAFAACTIGIFLIFSFEIYYYKNSIADLHKQIENSTKLLSQMRDLKNTVSIMQSQEAAEKTLFEKNSLGSSLAAFLEKQLQAAQIEADASWKQKAKVSPWFLDPNFEEEKISLTLKKASYKKVLDFMQVIYTNPSICLKEIELIKDQSLLTVNMLILYRYKKAQ